MKHYLLLFFSIVGTYQFTLSQNVGIGTTSPRARLHVADSSVLFSAIGRALIYAGNPPVTGAGRRMMWYADKAAFRTGYTPGTTWDKDSIGYYSFAAGENTLAFGTWSVAMGSGVKARGTAAIAMGNATIATGENATAMGNATTASGENATAMGNATTATGENATAMGKHTVASGNHSTAMGAETVASGHYSAAIGLQTTASGLYAVTTGYQTIASGFGSTAMGFYTNASGDNATAIGSSITASGDFSTAFGNTTTASGFGSTAMGFRANTNQKNLSFCIGGTETPTINSADNQMMMRFSNYTFWVTPSSYAYLVPASNGWAYTSDKNKKERFEELNGETVLQKISNIPFYSWNFKDPSTQQYRHYGIMAQDFFNAFGKDSYGYIGNDTTVSPLDLIGVNMAATKELAKENKQLKSDNLALQKELLELKNEFMELKNIVGNKLNLKRKKRNN